MNRQKLGHGVSNRSKLSSPPTSGHTWRILILVSALALMLSLVPVGGAPAIAPAPAAPPVPTVALPEQVDIVDRYEGQALCDPTPKPGTLQLRDTLWRTYGRSIWASISRDCNVTWDQGVSEHKDGRAIDWGVSVRNGTKAIGDEFFAWATANNGENARRMGIMYIIWDSRMWRLYEMDRGFPEYRSCVSAWTGTSYDTTCHRDHMHISMTWHGAAAWTSWYDGSAVTQPTCRAGDPVAVKAGAPDAPSILFDPLAGVGVAGGKACYLGNGIQTLRLTSANDGYFIQRLRIGDLGLNAPATVTIWTNAGGSVQLTRTTASPSARDLIVAPDGLVYLRVTAGQANLRIEGLGQQSGTNDREFVSQAYRDVLGRGPDPKGLDGWYSALLAGRISRHGFMDAMVYSSEASTRTASTLYTGILGRAPDSPGLHGWASAIAARAVTVKEARAQFWASGERLARAGTIENWVDALYLQELGRPADPAGRAGWSEVARTQGALHVARAFVNSGEGARRQVTLLYRTMLKRDPDAPGLAGWSGYLTQSDIPIVQTNLGASDEYYTKATL